MVTTSFPKAWTIESVSNVLLQGGVCEVEVATEVELITHPSLKTQASANFVKSCQPTITTGTPSRRSSEIFFRAEGDLQSNTSSGRNEGHIGASTRTYAVDDEEFIQIFVDIARSDLSLEVSSA